VLPLLLCAAGHLCSTHLTAASATPCMPPASPLRTPPFSMHVPGGATRRPPTSDGNGLYLVCSALCIVMHIRASGCGTPTFGPLAVREQRAATHQPLGPLWWHPPLGMCLHPLPLSCGGTRPWACAGTLPWACAGTPPVVMSGTLPACADHPPLGMCWHPPCGHVLAPSLEHVLAPPA
jgi:hypothetical protein